MAAAPQGSLPKQCGDWADLKAAYRFLSNPEIDPQAIQAPHRKRTREGIAPYPVVLCVQDDSDISFNTHVAAKGLGKLNDGGLGFVQHTTLAVHPDGGVLGILDQRYFNRVQAEEAESRADRQARWRESQIWSDAIRAIGVPTAATRFVHVMDRGSDSLETIATCRERNVGFILRARHDRRVEGGEGKLWSWMGARSFGTSVDVPVGAQRDKRGRSKQVKRTARVIVRWGRVHLDPPWNHGGAGAAQEVGAVYVQEEAPLEGQEPIDWMLLTSEPVESAEDAVRIMAWYRRRWTVEEFHRVEKEGCRIEASQLDEAADLHRLAAILSVIAIRLLQLRDLAGLGDEARPSAEDPKALQQNVPRLWIQMVARLARVASETLTPRQFWHAIARQGGWVGRKSDGRPGWKVIWQGWYDLQLMIRGAELWTRE
jgi:hypothetical protein